MISVITYSNPRMSATIPNWPSGSNRVTATFAIEQVQGKGERATRTTTGATKKHTYASKARIIDGSDGRIYIAEISPLCSHISIMRGDMKYQHEAIFKHEPRYLELLELFK